MLMSHEQNAGQNQNNGDGSPMQVWGTSNVYLRTKMTHQK